MSWMAGAVEDFLGRGREGAGGAVKDGQQVFELGRFDGDFHGEAVELGLGQGIGAFHFQGVLGGEDEEWLGHFVGFFGDADGGFGHGFQQCGLCFGGGAVDFIGEDEVAENGAGLKLEEAIAFVIVDDDGGADDVGGH